MYEEELQLSSKFQKLFDKLETVPYLKRENPWHRPLTGVIDEPTAAAFWKWFDGKVAELNPSYTWDLDTERAKYVWDYLFALSMVPDKVTNFITEMMILAWILENMQLLPKTRRQDNKRTTAAATKRLWKLQSSFIL